MGSEGYVVSFDNINVVYSGDYCLHNQMTVKGLCPEDILNIPSVKEYGVDTLITETTYGQKSSTISYEEEVKIFKHFTQKLLDNGYKLFIPSFAIGRSQEIALLLNSEYSILLAGLAIKVSKLYDVALEGRIFNKNTRYSMKDNDYESDFDNNDIVVASSGMIAKGSTSYNYLKSILESSRKIAVIKTGYISSESYGNELLREWQNIKNLFFDIPLSAHADKSEIISLILQLTPQYVVTIHGGGLEWVEGTSSTQEIHALSPSKCIPDTQKVDPRHEHAQIDGESDEINRVLNICRSNKEVINLIQAISKIREDSMGISESKESFDALFCVLYETLRLYPKYNTLLEMYRLTNCESEVVRLSKAIVQAIEN